MVLGDGPEGVLYHLAGEVAREGTRLREVCEGTRVYQGATVGKEDLGEHELLG